MENTLGSLSNRRVGSQTTTAVNQENHSNSEMTGFGANEEENQSTEPFFNSRESSPELTDTCEVRESIGTQREGQ